MYRQQVDGECTDFSDKVFMLQLHQVAALLKKRTGLLERNTDEITVHTLVNDNKDVTGPAPFLNYSTDKILHLISCDN